MAAYRNYSDSEKAEAVAYAQACNNLTMAARDCKVPLSSLQRWVSDQELEQLPPSAPSPELVTEKKIEIADRLEGLIHKLIDVAPERIADANLSSVMTAVGIAFDKMRLGREQSTTNHATVSTVEERDAKLLQIMEKGKLRLVVNE